MVARNRYDPQAESAGSTDPVFVMTRKGMRHVGRNLDISRKDVVNHGGLYNVSKGKMSHHDYNKNAIARMKKSMSVIGLKNKKNF